MVRRGPGRAFRGRFWGALLVVAMQAHPGQVSTIVALKAHNPYALILPVTDTVALPMGQAIEEVRDAHGVRTGDLFAAVNLGGPQPQTLCRLTGMCTALLDIHLSTHERAQLLAFSAQNAIRKVVFVSADMHRQRRLRSSVRAGRSGLWRRRQLHCGGRLQPVLGPNEPDC